MTGIEMQEWLKETCTHTTCEHCQQEYGVLPERLAFRLRGSTRTSKEVP